MADIFAPTEAASGVEALANPAARASANPNRPFNKKAARVSAGPIQAPVPRTFFDFVSQFLFGAPEFNQAMQNRQTAGLASMDRQIAANQTNNDAVRQRLMSMKLGAEAVDAQPKPAAPMDPLALFGGPTPPPPPAPGTPPTPQAFMAQHNARTPMKPRAMAPAGQPGPQQQAQAPMERPSLVFTPPGAPPPATAPMVQGRNPQERWGQGLDQIAQALAGDMYAPPVEPRPKPMIPPIGQRKYF